MKFPRCLPALCSALTALMLAAPLSAQDAAPHDNTKADIMQPDQPMHLVIAFRSKPANHRAFRHYLATTQRDRLDGWKKQGVILDYQILFLALTRFNDDTDAIITLTFPSYVGMYRWVDIEKESPAGLTAEGLKLGEPKNSVLADYLAHAETADRRPEGAVYEVSQYEVKDEEAYKRFAADYPAKMFANWMSQGALTAYSIYLAQNAEGSAWDALIVLEYKDRETYSHSAAVKIKGYAMLKDDPGWIRGGKVRTTIKNKTHECFYTAIATSSASTPYIPEIHDR